MLYAFRWQYGVSSWISSPVYHTWHRPRQLAASEEEATSAAVTVSSNSCFQTAVSFPTPVWASWHRAFASTERQLSCSFSLSIIDRTLNSTVTDRFFTSSQSTRRGTASCWPRDVMTRRRSSRWSREVPCWVIWMLVQDRHRLNCCQGKREKKRVPPPLMSIDYGNRCSAMLNSKRLGRFIKIVILEFT